MKFQIINNKLHPIVVLTDNNTFECKILEDQYQKTSELYDLFKFSISYNFKMKDMHIIYGKYRSFEDCHQLVFNASNSHCIKKNVVIGKLWNLTEDENLNTTKIKIQDCSIEFVQFPANLFEMIITVGSPQDVVIISFEFERETW